MAKVSIECDYCKKSFLKNKCDIKRTKRNFCSRSCRSKADIGKKTKVYITKKCSFCSCDFSRTEAHFKRRPAKNYYCSTKCKNDYLSLSRGGFTPQSKKCLFCQKEFTIYEKRHRSRKYCSTECQKANTKRGKEHHLYKDLKLSYREHRRIIDGYQYWRKDVFARDNYKCLKCGNGGKLNAHHIESYATNKEKRLDVDNGATLCEDCHKLFHSTYGKTNNNKSQFLEFLDSNIGSA